MSKKMKKAMECPLVILAKLYGVFSIDIGHNNMETPYLESEIEIPLSQLSPGSDSTELLGRAVPFGLSVVVERPLSGNCSTRLSSSTSIISGGPVVVVYMFSPPQPRGVMGVLLDPPR